jgi:hypothetical protein
MAKRSSPILGVIALTLMLAACGSGEGSTTTVTTAEGTDASVTAAIVTALAPDSGGGLFATDEAQCVALGLIGEIGLERMIALTSASEASTAGDPTAVFGQMTPDEVVPAMATVKGCVDLQAVLEADLTLGGFSPDGAGCVGDALVQAGYGDLYLESLLTGSDTSADTGFDAAFVDAFSQQCPGATHQLVVNDFTSWGVSTESATCVADAFVQGGSFRSVVTVILGIADSSVDPTAVDTYMTQVYTNCLTSEEQAILGITPATTTVDATTTTATQP